MRAVAEALAPGLLELLLRDLIDEYAVALEVAGRSRRTIDWYRTYLDEFAAFAGRGNQAGTLEDLTPSIARRWLLASQSSRPRPLAPNSMAGRVRTLRAFGGWLQRELQLDAHPLAGLPIPKVPDVLVPSLTQAELRALLEGVNGTRDSIRDRAILLVLLDTGLRLGELVRLSVGDIDLIEGRCRVMGKGAKERVVPIGGRTRRALLLVEIWSGSGSPETT